MLRVPQVLKILGIGRSTWYAGIKKGEFPAPRKMGSRISLWPQSEILLIAENLMT
ncbi:helix-turn-helix transcriptional regulator [Comamonas jiangduensis]